MEISKARAILLSLLGLCIQNLRPSLNAQDFLPSPTTNQIIEHSYYTLSYSEQNEQAEWVAYRLLNSLLAGSQDRTDDFKPEPKFTSGSASSGDFKGSGYDRGHLYPAGDMENSRRAMSEYFFMSWISPKLINSTFLQFSYYKSIVSICHIDRINY